MPYLELTLWDLPTKREKMPWTDQKKTKERRFIFQPSLFYLWCRFQYSYVTVCLVKNNYNVISYPPKKNMYLGGGFKHFLFSSLFGEDSHFD